MKSREKSHLYLSSVFAALILFSLFGYFSEKDASETSLYDENSKQLSILDQLSGEERGIVGKEPRKNIIAGMKVNVNLAGARELSALPGISDETAENIVQYRNNSGRFTEYNELLDVKGIKEKRLKKIIPFIEL
jgi:competence ComEA-like helix-hairpin-helix protein